MAKCGFDLYWVSCQQEANPETGRCEKHTNPICDCCGKPATRECGETSGPICCGTLLCDDCTHVLTVEEGCNFMGCAHVKPGEPNGIPWYIRDGEMSCAGIGCTLGMWNDNGLITTCTHYGRHGCEPMLIFIKHKRKIDKISPKKWRTIKKRNKRALKDVKKYIRRLQS